MTSAPLASRSFGVDDQIAFARLSFDWNPIHQDPRFARRTQVGSPIVHGIHALIWAANAVLRSLPCKVLHIRARFLQPLYLDETASVRIRKRTENSIELDVVAANVVVAQIRLSCEPGTVVAADMPLATSTPVRLVQPADLRFEQLAGQAGAVATTDADVTSLFPALADTIGAFAVKALLATSYIVGMACPGLHSLFAGLDIHFTPDNGRSNTLTYAVTKVDPRFRSLQIAVLGSGIAGKLEAFARPAPPAQPGMAEIVPRVAARPFAGQRSLVIGGSRGLGEVTAKIVAAGGGSAVITYHESGDDAERVARDIRQAGGQCEILRYDALKPAAAQLQTLDAVDCAYYFATPRIFQRKSMLYEPQALRTFLSYYADGFYELCTALRRDGAGKLAVFYPSTMAIEEGVSGTAEYAMAKMAGEILANHLNEFSSNIFVLCRRLPRILTDQTATVGVASAANALDVMLPIVYELQQSARPNPEPRS